MVVMNKKRVLLVFGGESSEHEVSIMSAKNVYQAIDKEKYDVSLSYISKSGSDWLHVRSLDDLNGSIMVPILGQKAFSTHEGKLPVDVLYPVLHGKHGEDGEVQGLASLLHVPCVGPGLIGAAVTMDKDVTKKLLISAGIPVAQWVTWHTASTPPSYDQAAESLGRTLFVKPANAGSSVGVTKAANETEFQGALAEASKHDSLVLIEEAIDGREIEVAVLGNTNAKASIPGEIVPGEEFYTYEDKYSSESTSSAHIPANMPAELAENIQEMAIRAYDATRGRGMARVDFFLTESGEVFCNEINSLPGFTNISMYPKLWEHEGLSQTKLIDQLIEAALE